MKLLQNLCKADISCIFIDGQPHLDPIWTNPYNSYKDHKIQWTNPDNPICTNPDDSYRYWFMKASVMSSSKRARIRLITHNKRNPPMNQIIQAHSNLLEITRKPAIKKEQLQVAYSRGPNLGDILTHTPLERNRKNFGCKPCNKPCAICRHVSTSTTITSKRTKKEYRINGEYTYQSTGAIYILTCNVGETSNTVNQRFRGHTHDIQYNKDTPVANHMNKHQNKLDIHIVDSTNKDQNQQRRLEEAWITLMDTMKPKGLNAKW